MVRIFVKNKLQNFRNQVQINNKYKFITFEGVEGSGKSTQAKLLADSLKENNIKTTLTREPGGTPTAEEIRNLLINGAINKMDGITETLLNFAARRDHIQKLIKPALQKGQIVISDRFYDSTTAYQGFAYQLDLQLITNIKENAIGEFAPDITFLIDIDIDAAMERIKTRISNNRYEQMDRAFHQRVRKGFLTIAKNNPKRVKLIDGTKSPTEIHQEILNILHEKNI